MIVPSIWSEREGLSKNTPKMMGSKLTFERSRISGNARLMSKNQWHNLLPGMRARINKQDRIESQTVAPGLRERFDNSVPSRARVDATMVSAGDVSHRTPLLDDVVFLFLVLEPCTSRARMNLFGVLQQIPAATRISQQFLFQYKRLMHLPF